MGGNIPIAMDVRIIAATNQNLQDKVREKTFREDLYYRLNVFPIALPPLRKRTQDIPLLVDFFLEKARQKFGTNTQGCSTETMRLLLNYAWPGNVRELENAIQRASLLSTGPLLMPSDFPSLQSTDNPGPQKDSLEGLIGRKLANSLGPMDISEIHNLYDMVLKQLERPLIQIVLQKTRFNQVRAAEVLGINRNTLRKKIQNLKIEISKT
jgi:two-component system nitrogen regulation response regulator GlnG